MAHECQLDFHDLKSSAVEQFIFGVGVRYEGGQLPTDNEMTDMRCLIYRLADLLHEKEGS